MDADTLVNLLLVLVFVLVGGVFAGTEMAIVSLRPGQVRRIREGGARGARTADLVEDPNRFLSAVQIGVTVAGFFSSAYGGATIAPDLAPVLAGWGLAEGAADTVALLLMTLLIAYLSLVLGELVPKRLAMQRAVGFTKVLAPPLNVFATLCRPVIWLLSRSTDVVVRLLGGDPDAKEEEMTAEEIRDTVETNRAIRPYHRRILTDVFRSGDRRLTAVMTPRPDVVFLDGHRTVAEVRADVAESSYSRYPVLGDDVDDVLGFVHLRDLLTAGPEHQDAPVSSIARPLAVLPGTNQVLASLARMRRDQDHLALVVDEYGGTEGIVTLEDLVEELVGEIYDEYDTGFDPEDTVLDEGDAVTVDGSLNVDELMERTGLDVSGRGFDTVGGYVVARLGRLGEVGDVVVEEDVRLEVVEASETRILRVRITRVPDEETGAGGDD
ncbi:hemolysin family protein [Nocardioides solisilvae]|uniref:hemolysin family protein n=1 Tax=Nocardioides solisilvae TaxID=1542435 RepID=UPI000D7410AE|nr:hemolysin family protein [Nocardioides solisilvae]